jgi:hypothetical protein
MYALTCVGIPYKCVPVADDGSVLFDNHRRWVEERRLKEPAFVMEDDDIIVEDDDNGLPLIKKRKVSDVYGSNEEDAPRFRLICDDGG